MKRLVVALFVGACAYLGGLSAAWLGGHGLPAARARSEDDKASEAMKGPAQLGERYAAVASKALPAVVAVEAVKPMTKDGKPRSVDDSGSGVMVRFAGKKGTTYVITNYHVIGKAPLAKITVNLADGTALKPTRVVSDSETDLAVLTLDGEELPALPLGDSSKVKVGHLVLALGSPLGLNQTVTHGIISARDRGQVSLGATIRIKEFLQTDAAINPGSSGGALVNLDGELIGINTAIASPDNKGAFSGIAFSIPINLVKKIALELLDKGRVTRGYLGVQLAATFESAEAIRLGLTRARGALVDGTHPETPASQAGLKRSDVILELDKVPVKNENDFINRVSNLPPGRKVQLKVWRDKKAVLLDAVVGDWSKAESRFKR
jgi:serine protease Do